LLTRLIKYLTLVGFYTAKNTHNRSSALVKQRFWSCETMF